MHRGKLVGRVLSLVKVLTQGKLLDRHVVRERLGITAPAADRLVTSFVAAWPELLSDQDTGRRVLRMPKGKAVPDSVAVAACFGASLSRLFEGSAYESAMRTARQQVIAHVKKPERYDSFDRKFYFVLGGGEMMLPDKSGVLDDLVDCVLRCQWVKLTYRTFKGKPQTVRARPLSLAVYAHQLYLIARDEEGNDRPFRFSRISDAEGETETFAYPAKGSYDPSQVFADSFGVVVGPEFVVQTVELRLSSVWREFAQTHRWHRSQTVKVQRDGVLVKLHVRVCPELEAWILGFGEDALVLSPESLRETIRDRAARTAAHYSR